MDRDQNMKKLGIALLLAFPFITGATVVDTCGQQFVYEKSSDFTDYRVSINFESSDNQIDVSAKTGYEVVEVWLSVDNDGKTGYWQYASGPVNDFNPNPGNDITSAKVRVKKVCTDVCTDSTATNYDSSVGEFEQTNNAVCTYPIVTPPVTPTIETEADGDPIGSSNPGSLGGRRHCDIPGTPKCTEWVKTLGQQKLGGNPQNQIIDILKQVISIYEKLLKLN